MYPSFFISFFVSMFMIMSALAAPLAAPEVELESRSIKITGTHTGQGIYYFLISAGAI
jgi:hypothetical protein